MTQDDHAVPAPFPDMQDQSARVVAIALAAFAAGYTSLVSHAAHLFVATFVIALLFLAPNRLFSAYSPQRFLLLAVLLAVTVLSALFGANPGMRAIGFAVFTIAPLLGLAFIPGPRATAFLGVYAAATVLAMAVWSWLLYAFLGGRLGPWGAWTPAGSVNLYGPQFNMLWPVLLYMAQKTRSTDKAVALRVLAALAFLLALLTFSRAAILTALGGGALLLFRGGYWKILALIGLAAFLASSQIYSWLEFARFIDFKPSLGRVRIWLLALDIAREHLLFGVSPGSAAHVLASLQVYHAHSNFLNLLLESGVAAAGLFLMLEIWLAWLVWKLVKAGSDLALYGCSIGAWLAAGQVATTLSSPELTLTLAFVVASAQAELRRMQDRSAAR